MEKLILFGGSFDPIHNGHLRIARHASLTLNADVVFVPAKKPRWKKPFCSIKDRISMINIAIKNENTNRFKLTDFETKSLDNINYTIDTVKHFKDKYPNKEICLLIGADQVDAFNRWKDAKKISELATIYYIARPHYKNNEKNIKEFNMRCLNFEKSGTVSSTAVRELQSLDIPYGVLKYIEKNNLYFIKNLKEKYYDSKRLKHAISVANLAYTIAKHNFLDTDDQCYIAGLLHDIGKKVPKERLTKLMKKYYSKYIDQIPEALYHQFIGEYLARNELKIDDEVVLTAIKFHASGKAYMEPTSKIIYCADKVDPLRGYDSKSLINICFENFNSGFKEVLKENKKFLDSKNIDTNNLLTKECMNLYLKKSRRMI